MLSHFRSFWLFATLWTVARQSPLSMGFSWQEYWSRLLCPPPGDLPHQGLNMRRLCLLHCRWILYGWAIGEDSIGSTGRQIIHVLLPVFLKPYLRKLRTLFLWTSWKAFWLSAQIFNLLTIGIFCPVYP